MVYRVQRRYAAKYNGKMTSLVDAGRGFENVSTSTDFPSLNYCLYPSSQVALECLSVLKESVAWLSRTIVKGAGHDVPQNNGGDTLPKAVRGKGTTPAPQFHGPNHGAHAARACIASTVPPVIDCFSRRNLRGPAEDVLAECAARKVMKMLR